METQRHPTSSRRNDHPRSSARPLAQWAEEVMDRRQHSDDSRSTLQNQTTDAFLPTRISLADSLGTDHIHTDVDVAGKFFHASLTSKTPNIQWYCETQMQNPAVDIMALCGSCLIIVFSRQGTTCARSLKRSVEWRIRSGYRQKEPSRKTA